ncbi:hypothetical protein FRC01_005485 [Tulasnella sp. 417]|nr:hypothetical protein FRC01_005485 [Tulasnella sp. 417]
MSSSSRRRSSSSTRATTRSSTHSPSFTTTDPSEPKGTTSPTDSHSLSLSTGPVSTGNGTLNASGTISVNMSIPTDMTFSAFMTPTGNLTSSLPESTTIPPTTTINLMPTFTESTSSSASATNDAQFGAVPHSSGMPVGAIVGIVLGVIAGTLLLLIAALCLFRRRYLLRRRAKERDLYGGASSTEYSNPFNDDKRYPSLILEKDNAERMYNYAMGTVTTNPTSGGGGGLLSPSTARDPFTAGRVRVGGTSPPGLPYDGYASSPTFVDHTSPQPTIPMTQANMDASYSAAGRMASLPKKSGSWRRSKSKRKKLAELKYRPNSTLTDGERNTTKTLIRIESSSSGEDHRGNEMPSGSYESGPRNLRDVGRGGRSVDGHDLRSRSTFQSYQSTQDGNQPFRFDDRPPYPREAPAPISSPPPMMDHRRARSDETHTSSQTIQPRYLAAPQAPRRPPRPDSDEGSTFQGISNLLTARSANAPASPPSHYAPSPSPLPVSQPPRRPFATRSSPTGYENPWSTPGPSRPAPAHFGPRAPQPGGYDNQPRGYDNQPRGYNNQPRGYNNQPGSMPNTAAMYFGKKSLSVEDDDAISGPSTFGEEGTLARSSESWKGGKAI